MLISVFYSFPHFSSKYPWKITVYQPDKYKLCKENYSKEIEGEKIWSCNSNIQIQNLSYTKPECNYIKINMSRHNYQGIHTQI